MSTLTRIIRFVRHWHARIGVLGALFFLMLSATGIALNHTGQLGLDSLHINQTLLMRWYGLQVDVPTKGFIFDLGYVAANEDQWVLNNFTLDVRGKKPLGFVIWEGISVIASADTLYLYSWDGRLVEKIDRVGLPGKEILKLGVLNDQLVLKVAQGQFYTKDAISWEPLVSDKIAWSQLQILPVKITKNLQKSLSPSLSLERIVLDVHSGRIFGRYGSVFMDGIAILLAMLSLTGLWMYIRSIRIQAKRTRL